MFYLSKTLSITLIIFFVDINAIISFFEYGILNIMMGSGGMETLDNRCPSCGAKITFNPKNQMWDCAYCGSKYTLEEMKKHKNASSDEANSKKQAVKKTTTKIATETMDRYHCDSCGAEILADENTTATFCVYCGNTAILKSRIVDSRVPDLIIPFKNVKEDAVVAFRNIVKKRPLVPKDFKKEENIQKITGVYIPFWAYDFLIDGEVSFRATDITTWSDYNYHYTKTSRYLSTVKGRMQFEKVLADASSRFPDDLMDSLEPFQYQELTTYNHAYLSGFLSEKYDVEEDQALNRAQERTMNTSISMVQEHVRHQTKTIADNKLVPKKERGHYLLLPVWMVNIKYRDKLYTFAMNGQTGKIVGELPIGRREFILWMLCSFFIFAIIFFLIGYFGVMGGSGI